MIGARGGHLAAGGTAAAGPNSHGASGRDFRQMSAGNLNIPTNGQAGSGMLPPTVPRLGDMARSPPSRQSRLLPPAVSLSIRLTYLADTAHVPCKFFKSGNCQAGQACPFSHDLSSGSDNVCKYFAKVCEQLGPRG